MTHVCVSTLTIIGSDNDLSPGRRRTVTWTNVGILLIGLLGTNFNEILIENPFENVIKMAAISSRLECVKGILVGTAFRDLPNGPPLNQQPTSLTTATLDYACSSSPILWHVWNTYVITWISSAWYAWSVLIPVISACIGLVLGLSKDLMPPTPTYRDVWQ